MTLPPIAPRDHSLHPPAYSDGYKSTHHRAPNQPLLALEHTPGELSGPRFGQAAFGPHDNDLLRNFATDGAPIGERILLHGQVRDGAGHPVSDSLIEIWQANASGRYRHRNDSYLGALDPNFGGCGRVLTDASGYYSFYTIRPGPYPWPNGPNDWRPAHIHVSVFGHAFCQRLITQLYFEGDPLIPRCPIVRTIPDQAAIDRLVARLDMAETRPFDCIAYRFDIVLRGPRASVFENRMEGM